ncbi:MAG: TIGR00282 family metallophosphoesterase [Firmicutes bacterium]|nr:TIGR00282 family metallophosphoesterase [Bacillota bacterium]
MLRILFIGDICGRPGRRCLEALLPKLKAELVPDLIIGNAENAAGGNGLTREVAGELFSLGLDVLTTGNHVWDKAEILEFIDTDPRIIRPANYPQGTPGKGWTTVKAADGVAVGVLNLAGRVFMADLDCPFQVADQSLLKLRELTPVILVDFHAEATSEKQALAWYLDGRCTAIFGTHTHVQTADSRILPGGTAYITDTGMTGPRDSVIGVRSDLVIERFRKQMPVRFEPAKGPAILNAVWVDIDHKGSAVKMEAVWREETG